MSSVIERLKEATSKSSMMMSRDFDVRKLIAAYEASEALHHHYEIRPGVFNSEEDERSYYLHQNKLEETHEAAVRELEGE